VRFLRQTFLRENVSLALGNASLLRTRASSLRSDLARRSHYDFKCETFIRRPNGRLASVAADRGRSRQMDERGGRKSGIYLSDCARGLRGLFFQKTRVFVGRAHKFAESGEPPCEVPFVQAYEHPRRKWRGNYVSSLARASVITFPFLLV